MLKVNEHGIPAELKERPQWVLWKIVHRGGQNAKVPYQVNGCEAKSNHANTWTTFTEVRHRYEQGGYDGIGYMFHGDGEYTGIDLDGCRHPGSGEIAPWAEKIIEKLDSYTEVLPSGTGVKVFVKARSPFATGKNKRLPQHGSEGGREAGIEMYSHGRFFAVTGQRLPGTRSHVEPRDLTFLATTYWPTELEASRQPAPCQGNVTQVASSTALGSAGCMDAEQRFVAWMEPVPGAVSGQGGHGQTFSVVQAGVNGFCLSPEVVFRVVKEHYNPRCVPPWSDKELRHKIQSAIEHPCDKPRGWLMNDEGLGCDQALANGKAMAETLLANHHAKQASITTEEWPAIRPFSGPALPEFPTKALSVLCPFVEELSRAMQVPVGMVALLSLAAVSAVIARLVQVEPRLGWTEPVGLFTVAIAEPGSRKSGTLAAILEPIREVERQRIEAERPAVARDQSERRQAEQRLKKLERIAAEQGKEEARLEALELSEQLAGWPEPALPRLICEDATEESVTGLMASQGGRICSASPEGGVFSLMGGRYSKNGDSQFDVYLKSHAGDTIIVDRISRPSIVIERPSITMLYAVQPDVIRKASENESFRGRGLWARFQYDRSNSNVGRRQIAPPPLSDDARQGYANIIHHLANDTTEITLRLDAEAARVFLGWETEVERSLAPGGRMEAIKDWGAKLAGATLRFAAALHCAEFGKTPMVSRQTIESAIEIARYCIPHAEYVLGELTTQSGSIAADAEFVLRWLKRQGVERFTKRDAYRAGGQRYRHADDIDPALDELQRRGYVRPAVASPPTRRGRSTSPGFEVNPLAFSYSEYPESVDAIDKNPSRGASIPNSVNCVNDSGVNENQNRHNSSADWGLI